MSKQAIIHDQQPIRKLSKRRLAEAIKALNKYHGTVRRDHPLIFVIAGILSLSTFINGAYLSLFTTGALEFSIILEFVGLTFLNFAALPLAKYGFVSSQPWWVWYILAFQWLSIAIIARTMYRQLTGKLKASELTNIRSVFAESMLWVVLSLLISSLVMYGLNWNLQQGAELLYALSASFVSLPIAIFTPLLDFNTEVWVLVVVLWIGKFKLEF